jgi:hypothetical protein
MAAWCGTARQHEPSLLFLWAIPSGVSRFKLIPNTRFELRHAAATALRMNHPVFFVLMSWAIALTMALLPTVHAASAGGGMPAPDFTKGDPIPTGAKHDWNLGATGARGWMYCEKMGTTDARQVFITAVDTGSPADGVLAKGDVLLGVRGSPFAFDPRTELGKALTAAESQAGGGKLTLTRWRAGASEEVTIQIPVLGDYAATAPHGCQKSALILDRGCRLLAERMAAADYGKKQTPITRSLNALALLARGDAADLPLVKREAQWAAEFSADGMQSWLYGYIMTLLSEYVLATGDTSVMDGLSRLALDTARGQSAVGSWGHKFARPDGRLFGYGMMNSPGIPLTIGLVLAREAGVKDPSLDLAIERSALLLGFYTGKGAIPYGDHHPWTQTHEDNGKCGMAAVLFNLLGEARGAEFFSRLSIASHGAERDTGHTGNFFNLLWAMPGIGLSGPEACGAWMREYGGWYFDLARRWDGGFVHQGQPQPGNDSYAGWDATGAYLLAYAMPLKRIHLTGKRAGVVPRLPRQSAEELILDGRGWSDKDRTSAYDAMSHGELLSRLGSWSPTVRERAAAALARRKEDSVPSLVGLLDSADINVLYGACEALIALRQRSAPAVAALRRHLSGADLWLRIKAVEALAAIGAPARQCVPEILERLVRVDAHGDPRGMEQRYMTFALFEPRDGLLGRSLEGVDREALFKAVRAGLKNQDGRARGSIGSVYRNLSGEEIHPLLPTILQAIEEPAPSGEMFADGIRMEGLKLLASHRVAEGIGACVKYAREQNPWASQKRTPEIMKILSSYGAHAQEVIPELRKLGDYFEKEEKDFPRDLMRMKAECVRETIRAIEAATEKPKLIRLSTNTF